MAWSLEPEDLRNLLADAGEGVPKIGTGCRLATVFALFVQRQEPQLLLIRRAERGDPWSGQLAFPGGHVQPDDADPLAACYRELTEEVGISRQAVTYLGDLGYFPTQTRQVVVRVFVGWWDGREAPHPDAAEVADVFEVPVRQILDHHCRRNFQHLGVDEIGTQLIYPLPAMDRKPPDGPNSAIWGVTARIIHRLMQLIRRTNPPLSP